MDHGHLWQYQRGHKFTAELFKGICLLLEGFTVIVWHPKLTMIRPWVADNCNEGSHSALKASNYTVLLFIISGNDDVGEN